MRYSFDLKEVGLQGIIHMRQAELQCWLVDDSPTVRQVLLHLLHKQAPTWQLHEFASGADLLRQLSNSRAPELILIDLNMAGMDGIELLRHLAARSCNSQLVICSGAPVRVLQSVGELCRALQLKLLGTILKPVTIQAVTDLVRLVEQPQRTEPHKPVTAPLQVHEVLRALQQHQFYPVYQPIIDLRNNSLRGFEVLSRCIHPSRGLVPPDAFIGSLEKYGLIQLHTFDNLEMALRDLQGWLEQGLDLELSVNLSPQLLDDLTLPEQLCQLLDSYQIPYTRLHLEVTESSCAGTVATRLDILNRLVLRGFHLSIDDFGTSFSSLERLQELPFDTVKLDKGYIQRALTDEACRASVESTLMMARRLDMRIVAEGIETLAGWNMIHNAGCDMCQGYYVAAPMQAAQVLSWCQQWQQHYH